MSKIALVMVIGPNEAHMAVEAIKIFKSCVDADIFLLDDCTELDNYNLLERFSEDNSNISLYRNEKPLGFFGMPRSLLFLLERVAEKRDYDYIIKSDPDGLIVSGEFDIHVRESFKTHGPGIVGPYRYDPKFNLRLVGSHMYKKYLILDLLPIGYYRPVRGGGIRIRIGFSTYLKFFIKALFKGYVLGDHILGGICIIHGDTLRMMHKSGFLKLHKTPLKSLIAADDVLISIGAVAMGHKLIDMHDPDRCRYAWVQWRAPFPITEIDVINNKIFLLHPLKGDQGQEFRNKFLSLQQNSS